MGEGLSITKVPASTTAETASPSRHDELIAVMLIAMLTAIIVCVAILRLIARRELRLRAPEPHRFAARSTAASVFNAPVRWLAVRSQNPQAVQDALGVQHVRPCSWSDALAPSFEPRLFIAPPVDGWILVMGCDLPDPADDIDVCFKFLTGLSVKLGEVQFFSRHRAVSHHGWARIEEGRVVRAYAWAGETLWNQGEITTAERDLKLRCLPYAETGEVLGFGERERFALNTERVVRLAAVWSIDPTAVESATLEAQGIAGDLLHGKFN